MENSGLRVATESLSRLGLTHGIPVVMLMSYRGDVGEDQWYAIPHGITMEPLLQTMRIPYVIVRKEEEIQRAIGNAYKTADTSKYHVAVVFSGRSCNEAVRSVEGHRRPAEGGTLHRFPRRNPERVFNARSEPKGANLYLMALGCHIPLALGVALGLPHRRVICLDTDGSVLLNLGILATLANRRPKNLSVIVFDNEMYECNGGLPSHTSGEFDIAGMALGAGIPEARSVRSLGEMREAADEVLTTDRHHFIVAKIEAGTEEGLPNKLTDGIEDKYLLSVTSKNPRRLRSCPA